MWIDCMCVQTLIRRFSRMCMGSHWFQPLTGFGNQYYYCFTYTEPLKNHFKTLSDESFCQILHEQPQRRRQHYTHRGLQHWGDRNSGYAGVTTQQLGARPAGGELNKLKGKQGTVCGHVMGIRLYQVTLIFKQVYLTVYISNLLLPLQLVEEPTMTYHIRTTWCMVCVR